MAGETPNGVSRGALAGTGIVSALVGSLMTMITALYLELVSVAGKQDQVEKTLSTIGADVGMAGEDRYRGSQAVLQKEHFTFRLNNLAARIERLESSCLGRHELQQPTQRPTPRPRKRT